MVSLGKIIERRGPKHHTYFYGFAVRVRRSDAFRRRARWERILARDLTESSRGESSTSPPSAFVPLRIVAEPNWLHVGGDGGLKTASVLLSVCASAIRHRLNPWSYLRDVLEQLAARPATADVNDLLPETWTKRQSPAR
jgi:hypothetical protein